MTSAVRVRREYLGMLDSFPVDRCRVVHVAGREIVVWRSGDRLYAMRDQCPHQGAQLSKGQLTGTMLPAAPKQLTYGMECQVVRCPWHGWEFSVESGEMLFGTGKKRLVTYPVIIDEGNKVFLEVKDHGNSSGITADTP